MTWLGEKSGWSAEGVSEGEGDGDLALAGGGCLGRPPGLMGASGLRVGGSEHSTALMSRVRALNWGRMSVPNWSMMCG